QRPRLFVVAAAFLFCLRCSGGRACRVEALPRRLVGRITIVSASNCRGHFLFSQLRKGSWLPRSFTLSTNNPQLSPTGRGNASPVEDSPWRAPDQPREAFTGSIPRIRRI